MFRHRGVRSHPALITNNAAIAFDTGTASMNGESARNAANGGAAISMRIVATTGAERFIGYQTYTISGSTDIRRPEWRHYGNKALISVHLGYYPVLRRRPNSLEICKQNCCGE